MNNTRNTNNIDNLSEISVIRPTESLVYPDDNESVHEILENYSSEINDKRRKIQRELDKSAPNPPCVTINNEKTVVLHELATLLENKTKIIGELTKTVKRSNHYEFPKFKGDAILKIRETLQKEITDCQELLERLEHQNNKSQNEIELLEKAGRFFEEMDEAYVDSDASEGRQQQIYSEIQKEYKEVKKDLDTVLDTLYAEVDIKEIIGDIIEKSSNGEWYEVTDPQVVLILHELIAFDLLIRNPENAFEFKMIIE